MILHGMNAERLLLSGEALGLGYAALERVTRYAKEREVFGRPIGKNQAVQHGLAEVYMNFEAAKLATYHAANLYDAVAVGKLDVGFTAVGAACNTAKYLAAEATYKACERAVCNPQTPMLHGLVLANGSPKHLPLLGVPGDPLQSSIT